MYEALFKPLKIGNLTVKNRLVIPPMVVNYCDPNGYVTERYIRYLETRAKGGWGLITTEQMVVSKQGKAHPGQPVLWSDDRIPGLSELTGRVHAAGAKINVQINHGGRQTSSSLTGQELVGPSAIPNPGSPEIPRELTVEEIRQITEDFGEAALRAKKAGFDMIMEHGHHGYLLGSFLSPNSNKRSDEYGGSLINRFRFAGEVFQKMREKVGPDFPIGFRMSGIEYLEHDEYLAIGQLLQEIGVDMIFLSEGQSVPSTVLAQGRKEKERFIGDVGREMKKVVSVPVGGSGYMLHPAIANAVLAAGDLDFAGLGRPSLVDPDLPDKLLEGREDDIRLCLACNQGCNGRVAFYQEAACTVNPLLGHEQEYTEHNAHVSGKKKTVWVAGGGIAGMEAAIFAAEGGHDVTIYEAGGKLGGQWLLAAVPPEKTLLNSFTSWQKRRLAQLGVKVRLNTELTEAALETQKPDAVIVATGAIPITPGIPGAEEEGVVQAFDVLSFRARIPSGSHAAVIGGGLVGSETAAYLALQGCRVTLLEMTDTIAADANFMQRPPLLNLLEEQKVSVFTGAKVTGIGRGSVAYEKDGTAGEVKAVDAVVLAIGARSHRPLREALAGKVPQIITIGDANQVRKAMDATREGYEAALAL